MIVTRVLRGLALPGVLVVSVWMSNIRHTDLINFVGAAFVVVIVLTGVLASASVPSLRATVGFVFRGATKTDDLAEVHRVLTASCLFAVMGGAVYSILDFSK